MDEVFEYMKPIRMLFEDTLTFIDNENSKIEGEFLKHINLMLNGEDKDSLNIFSSYLCFLANISSYHHRGPNFHEKIDKILLLLKEKLVKNLSNKLLHNIFCLSFRIQFFLYEQKI